MEARYEVSRVRRLSDQELLAGLSGVLGSSRRLVALLVVHLGEVEERRLHLLAGHGSLFAYCTERLGMSEGEACRRIEVARLARRFPLLIEDLATGKVSLSVAALLKAHLAEVNHAALLGAVAGKTVEQTREVLAGWFPRPDVLPSIRKLPQRRAAAGSGGDEHVPPGARSFEGVGAEGPENGAVASEPARGRRAPRPPPADIAVERTDAHVAAPACTEAAPAARRVAVFAAPPATTSAPARAKRASFEVEPLSPERYKVVFTAGADIKRKLDLARDLLRHAVPDGDLAAIMGRALELLVEKTLQRRFAKTRRQSPSAAATDAATAPSLDPSTAAPAAELLGSDHVDAESLGSHHLDAERAASDADARATPGTDASAACAANDPAPSLPGELPHGPLVARAAASRDAAASRNAAAPCPSPVESTPAPALEPQPHRSRHLPSQARRAVLERDGLRCTWVGPDGIRCNSRAWLEHDHIVPRGLGGSDDPTNIRIRCRAHNRLAAEQAYGQATIARIVTCIVARRRARKSV